MKESRMWDLFAVSCFVTAVGLFSKNLSVYNSQKGFVAAIDKNFENAEATLAPFCQNLSVEPDYNLVPLKYSKCESLLLFSPAAQCNNTLLDAAYVTCRQGEDPIKYEDAQKLSESSKFSNLGFYCQVLGLMGLVCGTYSRRVEQMNRRERITSARLSLDMA